jgi:4-hydroxy-3-polyprenylbenzoate decarboxylase
MKTALGMMGTGQLSLTKCIVLVGEDTDPRDRAAVFEALAMHFDPAEDLLLLPRVPLDTLDFTSYTMNLGSKMVLDAQPKPGRAPAPPAPADLADPRAFDDRIAAHRVAWGAMLVVRVRGTVGAGSGESHGRAVIERLVQRPEYAAVRMIVSVSEDVPLDDDAMLLWGIFTRFDCARDLVPARVEVRGAWLTARGPLGIDATWKPGYPDPVASPPEIVAKVDGWWAQRRASS